MEILTFDANEPVGWTVSVTSGAYSKSTVSYDRQFPGKNVGEHVTRLHVSGEQIEKLRFIALLPKKYNCLSKSKVKIDGDAYHLITALSIIV